MKNFAPWMVALIAFAALVPAGRHLENDHVKVTEQKSVDAEVAKLEWRLDSYAGAGAKEPAAADPCLPKTETASAPAAHPASCQSLGALREFLGMKPNPHLERDTNLKAIAEEIQRAGLGLHVMIALVADPLDSAQPASFDTALDAIQRGFADSQYRLGRLWLPWKDEAGKKNRWYREEPGIVLFQRWQPKQPGELEVVFLVGEAPKAGIQRRAFQEALDIAAGLRAAAGSKIAILGPTFSGSADSLREAMQSWNRSIDENGQKNPAPRPFEFQIATGSATADSLEEKLTGANFCRTVAADGPVRDAAFQFFATEMNWRLRRAALLAEGDTAYGQSLQKLSEQTKEVLLIRFPSHIAEVRTAWQHDASQEGEPSQVKIGDTLVPLGKPALRLNQEDRNEPVDLVPGFSLLTTPSKDLALSNVLETISRDGIRYVGILATDVNDKLFLAQKIRTSSPDSILFTFENNLLFAHPEYGPVMDGTLVASSAPLFTEGAGWLPGSTPADQSRRRWQFESESQEGTRAAVRFLLGKPMPPPRPQVWISVVGNGSLWPLRVLPISESSAHYCGTPQGKDASSLTASSQERKSGPLWNYESWLSGRANLQILAFAGLLCLLSYCLHRFGFMVGGNGKIRVAEPVDLRLLLFGTALLTVAAGVLLVVGSVPEWATYIWGERREEIYWEWSRLFYLLPLAAIYGYLATKFLNLISRGFLIGSLVICFVPLCPFLLTLLLIELWMPGREIAFFQLRALTLSSGLSPLVSLTLLTAALFAWIFCELARQKLVAGMKMAWPLRVLSAEALAGCAKILRGMTRWQERAFPRVLWLWVLLASLFLPSAVLLWNTIQPVAETKEYGRVFLAIFVAVSMLALVSFLRFFVLWRQLLRILRRLHYLPSEWKATFETLAPEVQWQATRSFAFRLPRFKMLALATAKLAALGKAGWSVPDATLLTSRFYQSEAKGRTLDEQQDRQALEILLKTAEKGLAKRLDIPQVRQFFAIRLVAHLRYQFAHLRNSLMAATGMGILILVAVTSYFFEPKQLVSLTIWGTISIAVALTFWSFLQMDRDPMLSLIGGTKPGQISFDKAFFANFALYVLVPALSVVATQFPEVGRLLGRAADDFLRVAGGG